MTRDELMKEVAAITGKPLPLVEEIVRRLFDTMSKELIKRGTILRIANFGKFEVHVRSARKGRNPSTGETMIIPQKNVVKFEASKTLTDLVNDA